MLLKEYYQEIYGNNEISVYRWNQLVEIMEHAKKERKEELKKLDQKGNKWYTSNKIAGIMLYVDNFSNNLMEFEQKITYLKELGITYVHFMPLLKSREGNNDGGYAVSDYLEIEEHLGDMKQFERVINLLKKRGIRTCIDFVLNHTAKEHIWAKKCIEGVQDYQDMYFLFDGDTIPNQYENTLTQIFPEVAPKNFTYYPDINKYVMTRFYEFQWDLNYKNPQVFNKIVEVMLTLANKGVDIFRLDAIPYMWKELGTTSMNLPTVHKLLKMLKIIASEVCPCVIFLGEAIVEPKEIVKYFGTHEEKECDVMYHASFMTLLWNSLATRDVRLMQKSLSIDYKIPDHAVWINYARCHDDIGWGFEENLLKELKLDPMEHKQFLIRFMEGTYKGSFSIGELYEENPVTMDARNSGTMASMCGLEQGLFERHSYKIELAIKRILLLHAMIISYTGIPLLYSGDEIGQLNNWSYKQNPDIYKDSRWLHRRKMDWKSAEKRRDISTPTGQIFTGIQKMLAIRKSRIEFCSMLKSMPVDMGNQAVFGFHKENKMMVIANFSEQEQWVSADYFDWFGLPGQMTDLLTERPIQTYSNQIQLGPYEVLWLV